jgi:hypothetical protein
MGLLRRDEPDQSPREFWAEIEERHGGKVRFYTFTRFIGRSQAQMVNLPGLLYIINNILYFEDFEKDSMLAKLISRKSKYEKTEFSIPLERIEKKQIVSKNQAMNCIGGMVAGQDLQPVSMLQKLFATPVYQIHLDDGESIFFEQVMDQKKFMDALSPVG